MTPVELRCDPSPGPGVGHLSRTLAVAQAWSDLGGSVTFVDRGMPPAWHERFAAEGTVAGQRDPAAPLVLLDGYDCGPRARELRARDSEVRLAVIDDHGRADVEIADLVVDQNLGADRATYRAPVALLGPGYAMLRREFRRQGRPEVRPLADPPRVLLAAGGSPSAEVAGWLDAVGVALSDLVETFAFREVADVPELLTTIDVAVVAAGSTVWELCWAACRPVLFSWADNQRPVAEALAAAGVGIDLGDRTGLDPAVAAERVRAFLGDPEALDRVAHTAHGLVDGHGAERVAWGLRATLLDLRPATAADARLYFDWANDPLVRASSFESDRIEWSTHERWFRTRLADPACWMYVVECQGDPIGQVRFEATSADRATIAVSLADRGQGWGAPAIVGAVHRLAAESAIAVVDAEIRPDNAASIAVFERAGFTPRVSERPDALRYALALHAT